MLYVENYAEIEKVVARDMSGDFGIDRRAEGFMAQVEDGSAEMATAGILQGDAARDGRRHIVFRTRTCGTHHGLPIGRLCAGLLLHADSCRARYKERTNRRR